jgi:hypothetical protein
MRARTLADAALTLGVLGGMLGLTGTAAAAAQKHPLVGPFADVFCSDLTPADEDVSQTAPGFVVFNANRNKVSAVVSLKDAPPNAQFPVRLVQGGPGGGGDCFTVDGTLTTNGQGKGTLNVAEPPVGTRAQVIIDTTVLTGTPSYRATDIFTFAE